MCASRGLSCWGELVADAEAEGVLGRLVVLDAPVLVVGAVMLGDVEPD